MVLYTFQIQITMEETPDLDAERFAILLDFMYTGELKLSLETVPEILATSSYLQVTHAVKVITRLMNLLCLLSACSEIFGQ